MDCAPNAASPAGFKIWRGSVPPILTSWAVDLRDHWMGHVEYGATTGMWLPAHASSLPEQYVLARKDHHTWTFRGNQLVSGICIPGITLYQQIPAGALAGVGDVDSLTTPDPQAAVFAKDPGTDWALVGWTFLGALAVVGGFFAGVHFAGAAARR